MCLIEGVELVEEPEVKETARTAICIWDSSINYSYKSCEIVDWLPSK
jgi:hypothetical protein